MIWRVIDERKTIKHRMIIERKKESNESDQLGIMVYCSSIEKPSRFVGSIKKRNGDISPTGQEPGTTETLIKPCTRTSHVKYHTPSTASIQPKLIPVTS